MIITKKTIELLHHFEDCKLIAYKCPAGVWTIGWGNTYYENGDKVKPGDKITQERADLLFENILKQTANQLTKKLGITVLNPNQYGAVLSFLYNIGPGVPSSEKGKHGKDGLFTLKNGKPSTLWRLLIHNPNDPLIGKEFVKWISPGSGFENGLKRRRLAEVELYFS